MIKNITKSGNSASITLDMTLLELIRAKIGDQVNVSVHNGSLVITPVQIGLSQEQRSNAIARFRKRYDVVLKRLAK
jgi:antitoxin component of MazEF toxin-antitoxin module